MTLNIRPIQPSDLFEVSALLVGAAMERSHIDPRLWKVDDAPREKIAATIAAAMNDANPPFRKQWLVAKEGAEFVGVTYSILLPVPPIYAGSYGQPGLIMEDCFVAPNTPSETRTALFKAAEMDLVAAGAKILVAASIAGGSWESEYQHNGYVPLTMFYAKVGLAKIRTDETARPATLSDVQNIVTSSAAHRRIIYGLNKIFWKPHVDADSRFGAWMRESLTLTDRDMFVSESGGHFQGYAIAQPATRLHFPAPHNISDVGSIDDFFHETSKDPDDLSVEMRNGIALLKAAETALERRGNKSVLVVCPAAWKSKRALLEQAGYSNAITWYFKYHEPDEN